MARGENEVLRDERAGADAAGSIRDTDRKAVAAVRVHPAALDRALEDHGIAGRGLARARAHYKEEGRKTE